MYILVLICFFFICVFLAKHVCLNLIFNQSKIIKNFFIILKEKKNNFKNKSFNKK